MPSTYTCPAAPDPASQQIGPKSDRLLGSGKIRTKTVPAKQATLTLTLGGKLMTTYHRSRLALAGLIATAATLAACSTTPADPAPDAVALTAETATATSIDKEVTTLANNDDGIRCRRVTNTGTHMFKRVCTTAAQREKMQEEAARLGRDGSRLADAARNQAVVARDAAREIYR